MGYSDSNYQIGKMLHKEYEATYSVPAHSTVAHKSVRLTNANLILIVIGFFAAASMLF